MFYQSIVHKTRNVSGAAEAAQLIKSREARTYEALTWTITGTDKKCIVVNDGTLDDPFGEVAVILEQPGAARRQIESITAGWIESAERLAEYFTTAITSPYDLGEAQLNLDKPDPKATAHFSCGCCGGGFTGNVKEQLEFDQDAGYGICNGCAKYYR